MEVNDDFWQALDQLVATHKIVIDRPAGSAHPRYPDVIYPLDYGYLAETTAADGDGIDVWVGSQPYEQVEVIICTVDLFKKDAEIKILPGCTEIEIQDILDLLNNRQMRAIRINRNCS